MPGLQTLGRSMRIRKSRPGALLAGGYLLVTLAVSSPLVRDGYIGHGNGIVFLLATALTSPLSLILLLLNDLMSDVNAFYMTGWPYYVTLTELGAGALLNAGLIYMVVVSIQRKWSRA
jgi:hypothetical protein